MFASVSLDTSAVNFIVGWWPKMIAKKSKTSPDMIKFDELD